MKKAIVIGSGAGGLSTAVVLAKNGYDVTVLEQGAVVGGSLQSFIRKGTYFETGMHILSSADIGQDVGEILRYLEVLPELPLSRLDDDCYQTVRLGDEEYSFASGKDAFVESMLKYFPNDREAIVKYADEVEKIRRASSILEILKGTAPLHEECMSGSIGEVLDSITQNRKLQDVLCGAQPLYAGVRDKTPFELHARLHSIYNMSSYRVIGGSHKIAELMLDTLHRYGGRLLLNKRVSKILFDNEKATGVQTSGGEIFDADLIVSTIHPQVLIPMLDSCPLIRTVYRKRIMQIPNTPSAFALFVKFKPGVAPYVNHTRFVHQSGTPWNGMKYEWSKWPDTYMYMHTCPKPNMKFAEGGVVLTYMTMEQCQKWINTSVEHRGEDYKEFKRRHAEKLIAAVDHDYPGFADSIEEYWTGTPLTYRDYCLSPEGTIYGVVHESGNSPEYRVSCRTKIPNLFIAGQNIVNHGLQGVLVGTIVATSHILGHNPLAER